MELTRPYGYQAFAAELRVFRRRRPQWNMFPIGQSVLGRPIWALETAPGGALIHASHHANEWMTSAVLMRWLWTAQPGMPVTVVPMVNPDGVALAAGDVDAPQPLWLSEACPPGDLKANFRGVDLNLNYPAGWAEAVRIKAALGVCGPAARDWPGPAPLSEPETRALAAFSDRGFRRSLALHSQGRELYWNYRGCAPEGARALGARLAAAAGYTLCSPPETASHGGYKDWFLLRYRRPAYTAEIGMGVNPLPLSDFPALCREVFPLLDLFCAADV